jgi:outer membrane protein OmpA-like peptidoglycan-associated protein
VVQKEGNMMLGGNTDSEINYWPGFVDIMSSLCFIFLFLFCFFYIKDVNASRAARQDFEELQSLFREYSDIDTLRLHSEGTIALNTDVLFALDEFALTSDGKKKILSVGSALNKYLAKKQRNNKYSIIIEGHTDRTGLDEHNDALSFNRALAVRYFWKSQALLQKVDVIPAGYGESKPAIKTADGVASQKNRRIEIRIVPKFGETLKNVTTDK